jgi:hypothetical protein
MNRERRLVRLEQLGAAAATGPSAATVAAIARTWELADDEMAHTCGWCLPVVEESWRRADRPDGMDWVELARGLGGIGASPVWLAEVFAAVAITTLPPAVARLHLVAAIRWADRTCAREWCRGGGRPCPYCGTARYGWSWCNVCRRRVVEPETVRLWTERGLPVLGDEVER